METALFIQGKDPLGHTVEDRLKPPALPPGVFYP
jgi:hypothetical protein